MRMMQMTGIGLALTLALALVPGVGLAKNDKVKGNNGNGHGIGAGGVPALRDRLLGLIAGLDERVGALEDDASDLDERLAAIEAQFSDDDGDTFSEVQDDCNDENANVNPLAAEVPANGIDDDCDHLVDEA